MHDDSLTENTEEGRDARMKLLLARNRSTRASQIDRETEIEIEIARSLCN